MSLMLEAVLSETVFGPSLTESTITKQGKTLNGHCYMATGKWPKNDQQKAPPIVFALFRLFSLVFFRLFRPFLLSFRSFTRSFFSLRPCRSSSVIFFEFWEGNFVGILAGILWDFFGPTKYRLRNFGDNLGAFFVRKFVDPPKNLSCQHSLCRRATLTFFGAVCF